MKKILVTLIISSVFGVTQAQIIKSKLDVVAGYGVWEFAHLGLRYQYYDQTQIEIDFGGDLGAREGETIKTFGFNHFVHFGKNSFYTNRPAWFARQGITYMSNTIDANTSNKKTYLALSAGREFGINDWLGVSADLGFNWLFREKEEKNQTEVIRTPFAWMPLARIQVFVSF